MRNANMSRFIRILSYALCVCFVFAISPLSVSAATVYESEPNNAYTQAKSLSDINYGRISTTSDVDWWKVSTGDGTMEIKLTNIPSGCDYDIEVYASNGQTRLAYSSKSGNQDELIICNGSMASTYYIKVRSYTGSSSSYYKIEYSFSLLNRLSIPNYTQGADNTCGPTSVRMILTSYGIYKTEIEVITEANNIIRERNSSADYTYVWVLTETINRFLQQNNKTTRYKYTNISSYTEKQYRELVYTNLLNSHPVMPQLYINNYNIFSYTARHYVVIRGASLYYCLIQDSHPTYHGSKEGWLSDIYLYNKAHLGYIICVD